MMAQNSQDHHFACLAHLLLGALLHALTAHEVVRAVAEQFRREEALGDQVPANAALRP